MHLRTQSGSPACVARQCDWEGSQYHVGISNPGDETVEVQDNGEIHTAGLKGWQEPITARRIEDNEVVSFLFEEGPRERTPDGDLEGGWRYVDVCR